MKYYQRLLIQQLHPFLFRGKALIVVGVRQVGKTTMLSQWITNQEDVIWLNADLSQVRDRLMPIITSFSKHLDLSNQNK